MTEQNTVSQTLTQAAAMLAEGDVTSRQLTEALLARIKKFDGTINSFIWIDEEAALRAADSSDMRRRSHNALSSLDGIPLAHKDMFFNGGSLCTGGSKFHKNHRPDTTATAVSRLANAGAIALGGLNLSTFAGSATGQNPDFGDCRNPWNSDHITGGSSAGSAAAVAARFVYASLGSDTGGSVRLPASACGVTGLKVTQGRISLHGAMRHSPSLDTVGPIARTAQDCALLLSTVAGYDPLDPVSSHTNVPDYLQLLDRDIRGIKIGVPSNYFLENLDAEIELNFTRALDVLRSRGAVITTFEAPFLDEIGVFTKVLLRAESSAMHLGALKQNYEGYSEYLASQLYSGYTIPAPYYIKAVESRPHITKAFVSSVFENCDLIATPTIPARIPTFEEIVSPNEGASWAATTIGRISENTRLINYLGVPAISLPCGFDQRKLPTGLHLIGPPFAEGLILKVSDAYQADTTWHEHEPTALLQAEH